MTQDEKKLPKFRSSVVLIGLILMGILAAVVVTISNRAATTKPVAPTVGEQASAGSCSYEFIIATPPPTTEPTAEPTPPPPVCLGLTTSPAAPTYNSQVTFICSIVSGATSYQFQYRVVDLATGGQIVAPTVVNASSSQPHVSVSVPTNTYGRYKAQCVPCNAAGCAPFEAW